MRGPSILILAVVACGKSDPDPSGVGTPTGAAGGTAGGTTSAELAVACALQPDNALRADCTATASTPGALDVSWSIAAGGPSRGFTTASTGTSHAFTVYGMKPDTTYRVEVSGAAGRGGTQVHTDPLPASVAPDLVTTGTATTPVLVTLPCADDDTVAIVDEEGDVIWYQSYPMPAGVAVDGGYHFTPDGTVLVSLHDTIVETALDGTELLRLEEGTHFPAGPLHHDVHRGENGLTYALFAEELTVGGSTYVVDGVYVFDGDALVGTWRLADHLTPSGGTTGPGFWSAVFPGSIDWSHGNSIHVEADGTGYASFRWLSTGIRFDADPGSTTFGAIDWFLVGEADSPVAGDFALSSSIGAASDFIGQHHVNPTPDGRIALFDNRTTGSSRGVVIALDEANGTADVQESWELGRMCMAQGSTYVLDSGNAVITCATSGQAYEVEPGGAAPIWTLEVDCGVFAMVPRAIPAPL